MLPLGRFGTLHSTDCTVLQQNIRSRFPGAYDLAVSRGAGADWSMRIHAVDLGRTKLAALEMGGCSIANARDGVLRLLLPLTSGLEMVVGSKRQAISAGQAVFGPLQDFRNIYADDYRGLVLGMHRRVLEEALADFGWAGDLSDLLAQVSMQPTGASAAIGRMLLALVRTLDEAPENMLSQKRFLTAHEELLILNLARILALSEEMRAPRADASALYLSRALDYMHAHVFDEIGPTSVARAAGCSLRNLQLLFQRDYGQTITGSLRQLRLRAAHARLLTCEPADTITAVAIDCGFSHLSDFARHYRGLFGELPSQTLARRRVPPA